MKDVGDSVVVVVVIHLHDKVELKRVEKRFGLGTNAQRSLVSHASVHPSAIT